MTFISYAQNYEDVMLVRVLRGIERGFYIDVGAQDPVSDSVTKAFYEMGWRGINIEPVTHWFQQLVADRPHDINLQLAVSDAPGALHLFEVVDSGLSTTDPDFAERHAKAGFQILESDVECMTLDSICDVQQVTEVHFLKIDCEGAEAAALRGLPLDRVRPWIILVEATEPNSQKPAYAEWESLLTGGGYHFVYEDGLNRFYVADERRDLDRGFSHPPNIFDDFVRASEMTARRDLAVAREDMSLLHDARRVAQAESECELLRNNAEYLSSENKRREEALVEHRRLIEEIAQREAQTVACAQGESEQWRVNAEYLRSENERREAALVEYRHLMEEAAAREAQTVARAQGESEQWRNHAEVLRADIERKRQLLAEREQAGAVLEEKVASLSSELASRERDVALMRVDLADHVVEIPLLHHEIGRLHHEVAHRDQEIVQLHEMILAIRRSTSWRITYPLRFLKKGLRVLARGARRVLYLILRWPARLARPLLRRLAKLSWLRLLVRRITGADSGLTGQMRLFLFGAEQDENEKVLAALDVIQPDTSMTRQATRVLEEIRDTKRQRKRVDGPPQSREL